MLTAAVRDLHAACPGQFKTDVRTSCDGLWEHNPWLTRLTEKDDGVEIVDCQYPLIHESNRAGKHFLHGFIEFLNDRLGLEIQLSRFSGDIHLSADERREPSRVHSLIGADVPFWIIISGGKYDYTIKWWHYRRYQQVVDHFKGRLLFVQAGEARHYHPRLAGVLDLRGKTTLRDMVRLMWHAGGVLCPVTFLMHLAAAVPPGPKSPGPNRPCVVVAGGREPTAWEAYPEHDFLHTIGMLPCCASGGCWRSRTVPLFDGDEKDKSLCLDVVQGLPHCMSMISAADVIRVIEGHVATGRSRVLSKSAVRAIQPFLARSERDEMLEAFGPQRK